MANMPIAVEYHSTTDELTDALKAKVERRLAKLMRGHQDITGASVAVKKTSADPSDLSIKARVILYHRPDNIAVNEKGNTVAEALMGALDALERQVRSTRERYRDRRRKANNKTNPIYESEEG